MDINTKYSRKSNVITGYSDDKSTLLVALNCEYSSFVDRIIDNLDNIYVDKVEWQSKYNRYLTLRRQPMDELYFMKIMFIKGESNNLEFAKRLIDNTVEKAEHLEKIWRL